jgi:hypothetical protein
MSRRLPWLALGTAFGTGSTLWVQHRIGGLKARLRAQGVARGITGELVGGASRAAAGGASRVAGRTRVAVQAGRLQARRRREELWHDFSDTSSMR